MTDFIMSQSDRLRQSATEFGGGSGTYNNKAQLLEGNLDKATTEILLQELQEKYPHLVLDHEKIVLKTDIAINFGKLNWKPESKKPFIKPDGGVLYLIFKGIKYPIIVGEAKQQGTNDKREEEGKKKQSMGNAIERACKNFLELRCYYKHFDYFPYHIFNFFWKLWKHN